MHRGHGGDVCGALRRGNVTLSLFFSSFLYVFITKASAQSIVFGEAAKTWVEPVEGVSHREFDFFFDVFW